MSLVSLVTRIRGSWGGVGGVIALCQWRGHVRLHVSGVFGHAYTWVLGRGRGDNNVMSVAWSRAASCLWCLWSRVYVGPAGGVGGVIALCQWRGHVRLHVSGVFGHAYTWVLRGG